MFGKSAPVWHSLTVMRECNTHHMVSIERGGVAQRLARSYIVDGGRDRFAQKMPDRSEINALNYRRAICVFIQGHLPCYF